MSLETIYAAWFFFLLKMTVACYVTQGLFNEGLSYRKSRAGLNMVAKGSVIRGRW